MKLRSLALALAFVLTPVAAAAATCAGLACCGMGCC